MGGKPNGLLFRGELAKYPVFVWNTALDSDFVISRPLKDAGTWRTVRLRAASLVPLRLSLSGSVSALIKSLSRASSRKKLLVEYSPPEKYSSGF